MAETEEVKENSGIGIARRNHKYSDYKEEYLSEQKEKENSENESNEQTSDTEKEKFKTKGGESNLARNKKKKKKKKENKKILMMEYMKILESKAKQQKGKHMLFPIEECFLSGNSLPLIKKYGKSLVLRIIQSHFKAKDYSAYQSQQNPALCKVQNQEQKEIPEKTQKYYERRYYLFSKYDQGIQLDEESWYSVTPEEVAAYISKKCKFNCILDAFCGAGGNSIQFTRNALKVYANDIDPKKIQMAKNNAQIYNVEKSISYINEDFLKLDKAHHFHDPIDLVFVSPPWGGINYSKEQVYDLQVIKPNFCEILRKALSLADNVVLFLPRNVNIQQLTEILLSYESLFAGDQKECVVLIEAIIYGGYGGYNIAAVLVFIGPLFQPNSQELMSKIKTMFRPSFDPYQSIIVQNIIKAKSFTFCYEIALQLAQKKATPNSYIAKLKESLLEKEWNIVKKLHKTGKGKAGKSQSLTLSPAIEPEFAIPPEEIQESTPMQ